MKNYNVHQEQEKFSFDITKEMFERYGRVSSSYEPTYQFCGVDAFCKTIGGVPYNIEIKIDYANCNRYGKYARSVIKENKLQYIQNNCPNTYYVVFNCDSVANKTRMLVYRLWEHVWDETRKFNEELYIDQTNPLGGTKWYTLYPIYWTNACFNCEVPEIHNFLLSKKFIWDNKIKKRM